MIVAGQTWGKRGGEESKGRRTSSNTRGGEKQQQKQKAGTLAGREEEARRRVHGQEQGSERFKQACRRTAGTMWHQRPCQPVKTMRHNANHEPLI